MAAKRLDNKLSSTFANLQHLQSEKDKHYKAEHYIEKKHYTTKYHALEACTAAYIYIYCLEKVYEQVHSKELCFVN